MMTGKPKVLRVEVAQEPVRIRYSDQILQNAETDADRIIEDAQKAAERIKRAAMQAAIKERTQALEEARRIQQEAEASREEIFRQTREQALIDEKNEIDSNYRPMVEQAFEDFGKVIESTQLALSKMLEDNRDDLIDLALQVARRLIHRVQDEDRELVLRTVEEALKRARERQQVTLHVHPDDLKILEIHKLDLIHKFDDIKTVQLEVDRRVDRGGVRIETPSGIIDARIRTQVDEIMRAVLPQKEESDPGP